MNPDALAVAFDAARPHLFACALAAARIAPTTFLCPVFGGTLAPPPVRIALSIGLAAHVHFAGGVEASLGASASALQAFGAFARELLCGTVVGFIAALPFDAARIGGRLLDTLRGANAEAALPAAGSREAATGDVLYQLLCAVVCASALFPMLVRTLALSFRAAPLGVPALPASGECLPLVVDQATAALGAGLAIGAPAAAVALLVDFGLALAGRAAPALPVRELAAPAKLMLGAAATLLAIGAIGERLLTEVAAGAASAQRAAAAFGAMP